MPGRIKADPVLRASPRSDRGTTRRFRWNEKLPGKLWCHLGANASLKLVYLGNWDSARRRSGCVRPMMRKRATTSPYPVVRIDGLKMGRLHQRTPDARHRITCLRSACGTRQKHIATPTKNRISVVRFRGFATSTRSCHRPGLMGRFPNQISKTARIRHWVSLQSVGLIRPGSVPCQNDTSVDWHYWRGGYMNNSVPLLIAGALIVLLSRRLWRVFFSPSGTSWWDRFRG
jgi:hypothetical protein